MSPRRNWQTRQPGPRQRKQRGRRDAVPNERPVINRSRVSVGNPKSDTRHPTAVVDVGQGDPPRQHRN